MGSPGQGAISPLVGLSTQPSTRDLVGLCSQGKPWLGSALFALVQKRVKNRPRIWIQEFEEKKKPRAGWRHCRLKSALKTALFRHFVIWDFLVSPGGLCIRGDCADRRKTGPESGSRNLLDLGSRAGRKSHFRRKLRRSRPSRADGVFCKNNFIF